VDAAETVLRVDVAVRHQKHALHVLAAPVITVRTGIVRRVKTGDARRGRAHASRETASEAAVLVRAAHARAS
jgi:hypothetical protein